MYIQNTVYYENDYPVMFAYPMPDKLPSYQTLFPEEHIGLGYLSSILSAAGINNLVWSSQMGSLEDVALSWAENGGEILGISPTYETIGKTLEIAARIKAKNPKIHIVLGGLHVSPIAKRMLEFYDNIDSIVVGEAEGIIVDFVLKVLRDESPINCPGVVSRNNKGYVIECEPKSLHIPLESLPYPKRINDGVNPVARVITSRGCHNKCSYCTAPMRAKINPGWRPRNAEDVVKEFLYNADRGVKTIAVVDDDFIGRGKKAKERAGKIASLLIKEGSPVRWLAFWCTNTFDPNNSDDIGLLHTLSKSGLERTFLGIESGSEKTLRIFKKKTTVKDNIIATKLIRKFPIVEQIGYMIFHPYTTVSEMVECHKFLRTYQFDHIPIYFLRSLEIHPGTTICKKIKDDGLLDDSDPAGRWTYDFFDKKIKDTFLNTRNIANSLLLNEIGNMIYRIDLAKMRAGRVRWSFICKEVERTYNDLRIVNNVFFNELINLCKRSSSKVEYLNLCEGYYNFLIQHAQRLHGIEQKIHNNNLSIPQPIIPLENILPFSKLYSLLVDSYSASMTTR